MKMVVFNSRRWAFPVIMNLFDLILTLWISLSALNYLNKVELFLKLSIIKY